MRKILVGLLCLLSSSLVLKGQYAKIGDGSYLSNIGGPFTASTNLAKYNSRFAYIYPKTVLGDLRHRDSIFNIEFRRSAGAATNSNCNLKIWIGNTALSDFGSGTISWSSQIAGSQLVYNQNPADIGTAEGYHTIPFSAPYYYDSLKGENLLLFVEYSQTATQPGNVFFYFETGSTLNGLGPNQTKYLRDTVLKDSLSLSNDYHPSIILNYPRKNKDLMVLGVYSLGKLPVPLGNPDSVRVLVRNVGKKAAKNVAIHTWLKGVNKDRDSTTLDLAAGKQDFFLIPSLNPKKKGTDSVYAAIMYDENAKNDSAFSVRLNNENIYSYRDITQSPSPGGIGFNGTTGDFVARFYSSSAKSLNQITVNFAITGRPFRIGIWDQQKGKNLPGKLIFNSDSLISVAGNYILDLKTPVAVTGTFFIGVRQLGTNNVAFGYQLEDPVRPGTFFYAAPLGDTNWVDFAPDAPYKFLIEPRMQGDTDLTVLSADYPKDSIDRYTVDTLAPQGTIANIGARSILDSFRVYCEIRYFGKLVYRASYRDTLSAGKKRTYTFPKTFVPKDFGEHELIIFTSKSTDQIADNDTLRRKFFVGVKKDVMVSTVFDPPNNAVYEYLLDTIMPVATIQNPGFDNSVVFSARCIMYKGNTVIYNQSQNLSLAKFNSRILFWPTYLCKDTGKIRVEFIVSMTGDKYRLNDTARRNIIIVKRYDLGIDSLVLPRSNVYYNLGTSFKPQFRAYNDGILDAAWVKVACHIRSSYTNQVYRDTVSINVDAKRNFMGQMKLTYKPPVKGLFTVSFKTIYTGDLVKANDSVAYNFHVGAPYDYRAVAVLSPVPTDTFAAGSAALAPKIRLRNNGYLKNGDIVPVVVQIWQGSKRVYFDIKSLNLDTGQQVDLDFAKTFIPIFAGEHKILAYTNYVSDVVRLNDSAISKFYVTVGKDASILGIDSPQVQVKYGAREDIVPIAATIVNYGKSSVSPLKTTAQIWLGNTKVYEISKDDTLKAFESKTMSFGSGYIPQSAGLYRLLIYTYSPVDQNIYNDTQEHWIQVIKRHDIKVQSWLQPKTGSVFFLGGRTALEVALVQDGADTVLARQGKVMFAIKSSSGIEVHKDSANYSGLDARAGISILALDSWDSKNPGIYTGYAWLKSSDKFPENDTLVCVFELRVNSVLGSARNSVLLYPNPSGSRIYIKGLSDAVDIHAYDMTGRQHVLATLAPMEYDVSALCSGMYTIRVSEGNSSYTFRFVRE